jgi:DNA-binding CsgD family transcriptional regulator
LLQKIDLVVIAVSTSDVAVFLAEELSRIAPEVDSVFVFDVAIPVSWSFTRLMDAMVDWSIPSDDLSSLNHIVDTIYDRLFVPIRRSGIGVQTTPRELEVLGALQEGLKTKEICHRLNMSSTVLDKHIGTLGIKFGCNGRISIAILSMREFGDLVGNL